MRRALAIAASVAMMLATGDPAMPQTPNPNPQPQSKLQNQPKFQTEPSQQPAGSPDLPLIKPSQALIIAQRLVPNSKGINVQLLPGGNYAVTLKHKNQVQRVIIDGDTGAPR